MPHSPILLRPLFSISKIVDINLIFEKKVNMKPVSENACTNDEGLFN